MEKYSSSEWTTTKLRAELKGRGLVVRGIKASLLEQLAADDQSREVRGSSASTATASTFRTSQHEECVLEGQRASKAAKETMELYDYDITIEKLALHLVCTEQFMGHARSSTMDPSLMVVHISKEFLTNVILPERWARYTNYGA
jgi:hypothetical protein